MGSSLLELFVIAVCATLAGFVEHGFVSVVLHDLPFSARRFIYGIVR